MEGRTTLAFICALTGGAWALLALGVLVGRLRARRRRVEAPLDTVDEWQLWEHRLEQPGLAGASESDARSVLERGLRSGEPDVRVASITALGRLGHRYEWAIDGLIEGLANGVEHPARVAAQLDRLAPRPGQRLVPLLGHPSDIVRFYAVRLLARYETLARRHAPDLTRDPSSNVRAAALETLRAAFSPEALRCALQLLDDPHARVRAHASLTTSRIAGLASAPFLVPLLGDESWWVREAAREALVAMGRDVATLVLPLLEADAPALAANAALVLQDVGIVDELSRDGDESGKLERILAAGGRRLRDAAAERARVGVRLGDMSAGFPVEAAP